MSAEENKRTVSRYIEVLNRRNLGILDELISDRVIVRSLRRIDQDDTAPEIGRIAFRNTIEHRIAAFPDYYVSIIEMIAEDDQVVVYWSNRGTHTGTYRGNPPTGKLVREAGVSIYRIDDGKIVEVRGFWDQSDFESQIANPHDQNQSE